MSVWITIEMVTMFNALILHFQMLQPQMTHLQMRSVPPFGFWLSSPSPCSSPDPNKKACYFFGFFSFSVSPFLSLSIAEKIWPHYEQKLPRARKPHQEIAAIRQLLWRPIPETPEVILAMRVTTITSALTFTIAKKRTQFFFRAGMLYLLL